MSRIARIVGVGLPHHITQRGNYGRDVFLDDNDRRRYLSWVQEYSGKFGVSILAYCLMPNHTHFIGIPEKEDSLAKTFNLAHMRYSQYHNRKRDITGHLWKARFYSCVLDEQHLVAAARYIERNPVRAGIVKRPWQWEWSSASAHVANGEGTSVKLGDLFESIDMPKEAWKHYIDSKEKKRAIERIRRYTLTGWPLGEDRFIKELERHLKRRLIALPKGRPRNSNTSQD